VDIKIERSAGRVKTVSARQVGDTLVVRAPADMGDDELTPIVERLKRRLERRQLKRSLDDDDLAHAAQRLNAQIFGGMLSWQSIEWVTNQDGRWGSCTPANGTIRLNHRLAEVPTWVRDYVIVHELAHLREANHGPGFWKLVNRYPKTERARGYLMALAGEEREGDM
jgi:hypothetical protein